MNDMADDSADLVFNFLDPFSVHLFRGPLGAVRLQIDGHDRSYLRVFAARAFPFSQPERYIGFLDGHEKDIGMVEDPRKLDADSRGILEGMLEERYFRPQILRVNYVRREFGVTYVGVETDRGRRSFALARGHGGCQEISPGRYLIEDIDENRFEIPSINDLDGESQAMIEKIL